jgi:hypothetical protein
MNHRSLIRVTFSRAITIGAILLAVGCGGGRQRDPGTGNADAGGSSTRDAGTGLGSGLVEYGSGRYAIYLSSPPAHQFCWFTEETVRTCPNPPSQRHFYDDVCFDDETRCGQVFPSDSQTTSGGCDITVRYDLVSQGPLYGTCDQVDQYFDQDPRTQCLYHAHCPEGRLCADYQCLCPQGATCACFSCAPAAPPVCEGSVLVEQIQGPGCDAEDRCYYEDRRTDCALGGGRCDPGQGACVGGTNATDGGVRDGGGGPGGPDGGDPGRPDAGCQCPPQLPPRCEGTLRVEDRCDPVTCALSTATTDCGAQGLVCDPETVTCVEDVECRVDADCPPVGPTPPGVCLEPRCQNNTCVEVPC